MSRAGGVTEPLSWGLRLKIVLGAARGLAFLHSSEIQVIYRDFKASNILLDSVHTNHNQIASESILSDCIIATLISL